jgi:hypothetical protein
VVNYFNSDVKFCLWRQVAAETTPSLPLKLFNSQAVRNTPEMSIKRKIVNQWLAINGESDSVCGTTKRTKLHPVYVQLLRQEHQRNTDGKPMAGYELVLLVSDCSATHRSKPAGFVFNIFHIRPVVPANGCNYFQSIFQTA